MGIVFCKNSFISELLWHFPIYGYDFQKILHTYGYTFEKFLRIHRYTFERFLRTCGLYCYDLNGKPRNLESQVTPPRDAASVSAEEDGEEEERAEF